MYFLMIRPQRRRMREAQELQRSMEEGDEVVTNAGLYGFVSAIDGDVVWLEIAENVEIRIARAAIARVIKEVAPAVETANSTDIDEIVRRRRHQVMLRKLRFTLLAFVIVAIGGVGLNIALGNTRPWAST